MWGKPDEQILKLHNQYGDVVRVGPDELSFTHPEAWREVCGYLKKNRAENGKDPKYASEDVDSSIIAASRERHGRIRRTLAYGFPARAMAEQQPLINTYLDTFMQDLRECGENGAKPLDMTKWYEWTTFDLIGDLVFSQPFRCLHHRKSHPWVGTLFSSLAILSTLQALRDLPFFSVLKRLCLALIVPFDSLRKHHMSRDFSRKTVKKRLDLGVARPDFVEAMLKKGDDYVRNFPSIYLRCGSFNTISNHSNV